MALTRAEWMSAAALLMAVMQGAYVAGVQVQQLHEHDRRITSLEQQQNEAAKLQAEMDIKLTRIDANVAALADRAREDREARRPK